MLTLSARFEKSGMSSGGDIILRARNRLYSTVVLHSPDRLNRPVTTSIPNVVYCIVVLGVNYPKRDLNSGARGA
jgi:hypothetical protein